MATYIQRAQALIEAGTDSLPSPEQQIRIADAFVKYAPDIAAQVIADPENPTNAEKAEVFVRAFRRWGKSILRSVAEKDAKATYDATIAAAGDAAESDL